MASPDLEKRTSGAKALIRATINGTAEAAPFVRQSLPQRLRVSEASYAVQMADLKISWIEA